MTHHILQIGTVHGSPSRPHMGRWYKACFKKDLCFDCSDFKTNQSKSSKGLYNCSWIWFQNKSHFIRTESEASIKHLCRHWWWDLSKTSHWRCGYFLSRYFNFWVGHGWGCCGQIQWRNWFLHRLGLFIVTGGEIPTILSIYRCILGNAAPPDCHK